MRVLTIGSLYPPHHLGGYEIAWRGAVERYRAAGHEVRVLATGHLTETTAPDDHDAHRELRWYWHDHDFPRLSLAARTRLERHNARVFDRHIRDFRPDLLSWWAMGGMSISLLEQGRRAGIPSIAVVCDDWLLYGPEVDQWTRAFARRPVPARVAERLTGVPTRTVPADAVDAWVFLSRTVLSRARDGGFRGKAVEVAYPGVDTDLFEPASKRGAWQGRLLYAGRVDPRKGIDTAVLALLDLPEATLTIDGDGDERHLVELKRLVAGHGLSPRVSFRRSRREELPARYAEADAVLFPVRWEEPWGLVPLEAMAVGTPVVGTGRGGSGEYLEDERNCLIFDPDAGPTALAAAVRRLANDPLLRDRLVAGGRETAHQYPANSFNEAVLRCSEKLAMHR